ncbi:uncharacterized protein LOC116349071 [Contarinia nasturtii]|uniref:uncharacterized protein LOC116349071 n=1 Tax=Contarinia nasturtii TaxID=265458 RepID=UPI0012D4686F|nr:uncharacterized protein LOC116349071 [Contarinia nasturtii]
MSGSFYLGIGTSSIIVMYWLLAMDSKLIIDLVEFVEKIVKKRAEQSDGSKNIYIECNDGNISFVRKMKMFSIYVIITTITVPILCPIGNAIFKFPPPKMWFFPFPIAVWWNTTHALGYYVALLPQIGCTAIYMISISIMITFFSGICTYVEACVDDLSTLIPQMNEITTNFTTNCHNWKSTLKLRYTIFDLIELHTDILRMGNLFAVIISGPLFFQLLVYVVFLALNLLQFDQEISDFSLAMALNINALLNQVLLNYVTCNYSTNVALKVCTVADVAFDAHWYSFPVADQKLFPLLIQRTQKQIRLSGYDIINCSRETFILFLKSAVSYFLVFRRLS